MISVATGGSRQNFVSIQYIRGIAAALVVLAHSIEHPMKDALAPVVFLGQYGVEIFFAISGFIIVTVCGESAFSPGGFLLRRLFRVAPLYWATTIITALIAILAPSLFKTTVFGLDHFIQSMLFIPHPDPVTATEWRPLYKVGWTLNYELFFYAITATLFWVKSLRLRAVILIVGLSIFVGMGPLFGGVARYYASVHLLSFLGGAAVALGLNLGLHRYIGKNVAIALLLSATVLSAVLCWTHAQARPNYLAMSLGAFLFVAGAVAGEKAGGVFKSRLLSAVGDSSYSVYLTNIFVVAPVWLVLLEVFPAPPPAIFAIGVASAFAASMIAGYLCYRIVEKPLNAWLHGVADVIAPRRNQAEAIGKSQRPWQPGDS